MSTKIVRKYVEFFTFFPQKRPKNAEFGKMRRRRPHAEAQSTQRKKEEGKKNINHGGIRSTTEVTEEY